MDRLTTGRRYPRAGSVTVTELLVRQTSPTLCADSSPSEPDEITETIPVLGPASHRRRPRGAQFAKLASIGVAGAVLCGAVTVSSMIAAQRRENTQAKPPTPQITGDDALLPRLDRTRPSAPPVTPPVVPPARRAPAPKAPPVTSTRTDANAGVTVPSAGTTDAAAAEDDSELVREFYRKLPESPASAFELLSPALQSGFGEFLDSWSQVVSIESLNVLQQADGVLATVRMRLLGGGHLRVQQMLTVAESPRRITGVQLLSAQLN